MKKLFAMAVGCFMAILIVTAAGAAPRKISDNPRQAVGIQNARKAMKAKLEKARKTDEVRKNGQAQRKLIQSSS